MTALWATLTLAVTFPFMLYSALVSSDLPFTALFLASITLAIRSDRPNWRDFAIAGAFGGLAYLLRYQALVLIIAMWAWLVSSGHRDWPRLTVAWMAGFLIAASPQLVVSLAQTGNPFYNMQAKNIWFGIYAYADWSRWNEVPDTISLAQVVAMGPQRFAANWLGNIASLARNPPLPWPLMFAVLPGLIAAPFRKPSHGLALVYWVAAIFIAATCLAFVMPRLFVPILPFAAMIAAWFVRWLVPDSRGLWREAIFIAMLAALVFDAPNIAF
jgi:hypothetical protein